MKHPLAIISALIVFGGAAWAQGGGGGGGGGSGGGSGGAGSTGGAAGSSGPAATGTGSPESLSDPTRGTNATAPARPGLNSTTGSGAPGEALGVRPRPPSESERASRAGGSSVTGAGSPQATPQFDNGTPRIMAPER